MSNDFLSTFSGTVWEERQRWTQDSSVQSTFLYFSTRFSLHLWILILSTRLKQKLSQPSLYLPNDAFYYALFLSLSRILPLLCFFPLLSFTSAGQGTLWKSAVLLKGPPVVHVKWRNEVNHLENKKITFQRTRGNIPYLQSWPNTIFMELWFIWVTTMIYYKLWIGICAHLGEKWSIKYSIYLLYWCLKIWLIYIFCQLLFVNVSG